MFLRTLVRAGVALLAGVSVTRAVSVVEDNLHATEAGHIEIQSKVHNATGIRYVKNSGICETTPNVTQISGYINVGTNMSMWFWFFESRNSPKTAPFTLWLNGGPGCSSMIGLFQENGPCLVNADQNSTILNPYSWNSLSNMIYIDQPIGTGFSYGTDAVNSTETAAPFVWTAFQVLFESQLFSKYASRELIFATESYGGHYGPSFVTYFEERNALIASGEIDAVPVVVSALMINEQNIAFLNFATYAPGYGQLQPDDVLKNISDSLYGPDGCVAQESACYAAGNSAHSNKICRDADNYCGNNVFTPAVGNYDSYDIRQNSSSLFPPEYYVYYLQREDVMKKIGAHVKYEECSDPPYEPFVNTGDDARTWLPQLSALANSGLKILIWAGDADMVCNWLGGHASVLAMDWYGNETLHNTPFTNMTINGKPIAAVQNVDNFSFARVYAAGHEVPAFQPQAALEIFSQVVRKEQLHSV
ncbi:Alpha/Beta hydrolase protein [Suillus subalutaceus]|uniref:Alpha/Beta hydrolase protein n=1 Tax=Suillus subalutaceus TaxID=48586 RepID=UPI001B877E2F|nr:Alpha/Beta hydrolase protein [Suillus subalutaceus]KAG1872904.1 Alpha/Beta hydrolase protein [Suillus subalutaceus]